MAISEKELKAFVTLTEQQHFAKASDLLNMTPSALSRLIQRLEHELEVVLFYRDKRTVETSEAGKIFLEYAKDAIFNLEEVKSKLTHNKKIIKDSLSLYCSVTAAYGVLNDLLPKIKNNYPDLEILLRTGDATQAIERVLSSQEHMAITAKPKKLPSQLLYTEIMSSKLCLIIPKSDNAIRQAWLQDPSEWYKLPWILSETGVVREQFDRWIKQQGIKVNVYSQASGHEAIVSMVSLGYGIGVVPDIVLAYSSQQDNVEMISVDVELPMFSIGLCIHKKTLIKDSMKAIWNLI